MLMSTHWGYKVDKVITICYNKYVSKTEVTEYVY